MSDDIYKTIANGEVLMARESKINENYIIDMSSRLHRLEKRTKSLHAGLVVMSIVVVALLVVMLGLLS